MAERIRINKKYDMQGEYQPSDSDDDYSATDKKLLEKVRKRRQNNSESEEEVYAFSESDDDSDDKNDFKMADSDVEGQEEDNDDLPDQKAWGKNKKSFYSTDYVDEDYGGFGNEEETALMEEEEAKNIQKRLLQQLGDDDFSLDFFTTKKTDKVENQEVIKSDLSQLSKRQKLQLLEKESPEFAGLVEDFKTKLTVAKDDLQPVLNLVKDGKLPKCSASKFVKTNYDLILNYCTNISFYLLLKAKRISIQNHPVVKRLYQYRQMLNQMEPIYMEVIKPQIDSIMSAISNDIELVTKNNETIKNKKRKYEKNQAESTSKKLKLITSLEKEEAGDTGVSDNEEEYEGNDFFKSEQDSATNPNMHTTESEESGYSDNGEDTKETEEDPDIKPSTSSQVLISSDDIGEKRDITYQISKNKGLTPHRKKDQRNPRVKHKLKYRKAKIRRKGAVREPRTEVTRYGGEVSGIKSNVKKSIKIK